MRISASSYCHQLGIVRHSGFSQLRWCEMFSKVLICISMITSETEYLFMFIKGHSGLFSYLLFLILHSFSIACFFPPYVLFFLICKNFLSKIFWIQILCYMHCKSLLFYDLIFLSNFIFLCKSFSPTTHTSFFGFEL